MSDIRKQEITAELKDSYLQYAMSVIVSRALPDARDGLKPVQRRVLWAMWESGVVAPAKYRKSATIVGDTMGRYHPHGDSAIYDTMVRMAQDFSLRYQLVDGQGNFGSVDGDSAAAMRYTEARMSRIASELLVDIDKNTVDWLKNYDGTRDEPVVLPAKLPNLLLNGAVGIAVGMATSIPPHNLRELCGAILHLAENPDASVKDLAHFVKGPDFPTGGIIFDEKAILTAYETGRGAVAMRARSEILEKKAGQYDIVITEIPYQVNKSELIKKIAELAQEKKIEGIKNLRDESDREGLRIVIELKNDSAPQKVLNQLYRHTDLHKDFHFNMIALSGGLQPQLMSLKDILAEYLGYRKDVIRRRTQFDLDRARERAHILEGLMIALLHIDEIIAVIRKSKDKDDAKANLIKKFKLTEAQTVAILEMRLQSLASLERLRVEAELAASGLGTGAFGYADGGRNAVGAEDFVEGTNFLRCGLFPREGGDRVVRNEIDFGLETAGDASQVPGLFGRVVDAVEEHIFEGDFLFFEAAVFLAGIQEPSQRIFPVDRHQLIAQLVAGGMQRDGEHGPRAPAQLRIDWCLIRDPVGIVHEDVDFGLRSECAK